jgi:hypothetical protein
VEQCKADQEWSFQKRCTDTNVFNELYGLGRKLLFTNQEVTLPLSESGDFTPVAIEGFVANQPLSPDAVSGHGAILIHMLK